MTARTYTAAEMRGAYFLGVTVPRTMPSSEIDAEALRRWPDPAPEPPTMTVREEPDPCTLKGETNAGETAKVEQILRLYETECGDRPNHFTDTYYQHWAADICAALRAQPDAPETGEEKGK